MLFVLGIATAGFAAGPAAPALPASGMNLPRAGGGWLNVLVRSNRMVVTFFGDRKEPVAPDVHHGLARYQQVLRGDHRTALHLSRDSRRLVSPADVGAPHEFLVTLALYNNGPGEAAETHEFFYRAPSPGIAFSKPVPDPGSARREWTKVQ
jgi:hypothetical protein